MYKIYIYIYFLTLCCCITLNQLQLVDHLSSHSLFHLTFCLILSYLQWHYCYLYLECVSYPAYVHRTCKHSPQRETGLEISLVDWARTPCQSMLVSGRPGQTHEHTYSYTVVLINISAASSIIHTHAHCTFMCNDIRKFTCANPPALSNRTFSCLKHIAHNWFEKSL